MALISLPSALADGTVAYGSEVLANDNAIKNDYNGNIQNVNIAANAGIVDSKLAQIATPNKVNATAITGVIAMSSLATGTPTGLKFIRDDGTLQTVSTAPTAGMVLQVVNAQTATKSTSATAIPDDDSIPQNTEGVEVITVAITPGSATNKLKIDVLFNGASSGSEGTIVALFQDTTADALSAVWLRESANFQASIPVTYFMTAGTTSATTFKVRAGSANSGTVTINGNSGNRVLGGALISSITVTEIKV